MLRGKVRRQIRQVQYLKEAVLEFLDCGDYSKGIARIRCTNPECGYDYFRPFVASLIGAHNGLRFIYYQISDLQQILQKGFEVKRVEIYKEIEKGDSIFIILSEV